MVVIIALWVTTYNFRTYTNFLEPWETLWNINMVSECTFTVEHKLFFKIPINMLYLCTCYHMETFHVRLELYGLIHTYVGFDILRNCWFCESCNSVIFFNNDVLLGVVAYLMLYLSSKIQQKKYNEKPCL
jgi:hypothetical protein